MNSKERRSNIVNMLVGGNRPLKGQELAEKFNVTRQVIVKDVAIIRAEGTSIIATPEGYLISKYEENRIRKVIAVSHDRDEMDVELNTIVKYGGIVEDVIVEHPLYGEIKSMLMIKNLNDVEKFVSKFKNTEAEPLSLLTNGVHVHTISAESEKQIIDILKELEEKNILIDNG